MSSHSASATSRTGVVCLMAACTTAVLCSAFIWIHNQSMQGMPHHNLKDCSGPQLTPAPAGATGPWMDFHHKMTAEIEQAEAHGGFDLLFFGDSISENWRGTGGDRPSAASQAIHDVWNKYFGAYNADVMAIAGDEIAHLHWRMLNGEMPHSQSPNASVVLIGTNDLYAAGACAPGDPEESITDAADSTAERLKAVLSLMRERMPDSQIILMALLPRSWVQAGEWPSAYTKAMEIINDRMQGLALTDDHVHYVDCGSAYLLPDGKGLSTRLVPDGIHPNAEGMTLMAECLTPLVAKFVNPRPGAWEAASGTGLVSQAAKAVDDKRWEAVAEMIVT